MLANGCTIQHGPTPPCTRRALSGQCWQWVARHGFSGRACLARLVARGSAQAVRLSVQDTTLPPQRAARDEATMKEHLDSHDVEKLYSLD